MVKAGLVTWDELVKTGHCSPETQMRRPNSQYVQRILDDVAQLRERSKKGRKAKCC
jgi:hypothetical protein